LKSARKGTSQVERKAELGLRRLLEDLWSRAWTARCRSRLRSASPHRREAAALALGRAGSRAALDALCVALHGDDDYWVRRAAASALGDIGDERALQPLGAALRDSVTDVRQAAVVALSKLPDPRARVFLERALKDPSADVRSIAGSALGASRPATRRAVPR
jgi:HEAT repeat protein